MLMDGVSFHHVVLKPFLLDKVNMSLSNKNLEIWPQAAQ